MSTHLPTLLLLTLLFSAGCKTGAEGRAETPANRDVAGSPTPNSEPEPSMPLLKAVAKYMRSAGTKDPQVIADYANDQLPKYGFEYELDLERIITKKIEQGLTTSIKLEGDDFPYVTFDLEVTSTNGAKRKLAVTAPAESVCCCGYYYTPIPVTKITPKELSLVIDSQETVIARPKDIPVVQEYILAKDQLKPSKLRSWEVPYETYPYGLSGDGRKLYVEVPIDEILLEISDDGVPRFVPRNATGIFTEGEDLRKLPTPKQGEILRKSGELGLMRYMLSGVPYILEFPYPCT